MNKTKKWLLVTGILALCVIVTCILFRNGVTPQNGGDAEAAETEDIFVPIDQMTPFGSQPPEDIGEESTGNPVIEDAPEVSDFPAERPTDEHEQGGSEVNGESAANSEPAANSESATNSESEVEGEHVTENEAETEISQIPEESDTATSSAQPDNEAKDPEPKSGDKNDKGEIYSPGFGWVKDEGGGGEGEISVGKGSMDIMVGH
jgi:hypothetical protein